MSISKNILIFLIENRKKRKSPDISGFSSYKKVGSFLLTSGGIILVIIAQNEQLLCLVL